jgi:hypothetical protein
MNAAKDLFYTLVAKFRDGYPETTVSKDWKELLDKK